MAANWKGTDHQWMPIVQIDRQRTSQCQRYSEYEMRPMETRARWLSTRPGKEARSIVARNRVAPMTATGAVATSQDPGKVRLIRIAANARPGTTANPGPTLRSRTAPMGPTRMEARQPRLSSQNRNGNRR